MARPEGDDGTGPADRVVRGLRECAPSGWQRLEASFAITVVAESALLIAHDGARSVRFTVSDVVWDAVRRHRRASADLAAGPWWRLIVRIDAGKVEIIDDRGAEPFPSEQLFAPDAYLADLESFPRDQLPVWLAAYLGWGTSQTSPPRHAAERMRADQRAGMHSVVVHNELPDLVALWARWAVLSAAFVAVGSPWGPRVFPSTGMFESAGHSGSTLTILPGDRAVFSGGVWNAPALDAAYNRGAEMPRFFAGAPAWVADPVLNPRVATGLLSFCYWWEHGRWYRGESAPMSECAPAVPAVWTADTVVEVIASLIDDRSNALIEAAHRMVSEARSGTVTRATITNVFGSDEQIDIDGAMFQFMIAGLVADRTGTIPEVEALDLVRGHIREHGYDTTGYPVATLRADRIPVGWVVHSPVPAGEIALDRTVFYVADDGVVERSTSSVRRSEFMADFEQRFRLRRNG